MIIPAWYLVVYTVVLVFGVCLYCTCRLKHDDMIPSEATDPDEQEEQLSPEVLLQLIEIGLVNKTIVCRQGGGGEDAVAEEETSSSHVKIVVDDDTGEQQQDCNDTHRVQEQDNSTATTTISLSEAPQQCEICLLDYQEGDVVSWSPNKECPHAFHKECITEWLLKTNQRMTCPCCRRNYLNLNDEDNSSDEDSGDENTSTESIHVDEFVAAVRVQ